MINMKLKYKTQPRAALTLENGVVKFTLSNGPDTLIEYHTKQHLQDLLDGKTDCISFFTLEGLDKLMRRHGSE